MCKEDNKYGVLNDFDLSTIMQPGDRNPNRQGLERTGTLPFMAVELLHQKGFDGKIPRRYDHELESFVWVLVWVSRCVAGGEECKRPQRLKEWLGHNNDEVYKSKLAFIQEQWEIPTTQDYESLAMVIQSWVDMWNSYRQLARRGQILFTKNTDTKHLQTLIAACEESAEADCMASVPIDVTWVDGLADLKFPTPDVSALLALPPDPTEVEEHPPLHRSSHGASPSGGGNLDVSYDDIYMDDDGASVPNETDFDDTDGDDNRRRQRKPVNHEPHVSSFSFWGV